MKIGTNIGRKVLKEEGNGMIMNTIGRRNSLGSSKNILMLGEDGLEVKRNIGFLGDVNGMELCNNVGMTFFEEFFHTMGTNDLMGTFLISWNLYCWHSWLNFMVNSLKSMRMVSRVLKHMTPNTMSQPPMSIAKI
jgi:hypothetical protein